MPEDKKIFAFDTHAPIIGDSF